MKNLHGFSIMWTYSRRMLVKFSRRTFSCAVSSPCVQNQRNSLTVDGRVIAKLNLSNLSNYSSRNLLLSDNSVGHHISCQTFSTISPRVSNGQGEMTVHEITSDLEDSLKSYEDVENEVERQRDIWNVGPAFRPSFNLASFVNESTLLQEFLKMGVELHKWEMRKPELLEYILKLDFQRDVSPYVRFLCDNGIPPDRLSYYFTKNPMILQEDLVNLNLRVEYLKSKAFTTEQIHTIIATNPRWLLFSTTEIDERLGYLQTLFKLTGNEIRKLATIGAKTVTTKKAAIMEMTFKVKEEMGFEPDEIKSILLSHPSIWRQRAETIWRRFDYLHNHVKFSHEVIARSAKLLLTREGRLKGRIGYLQHLGRAQFNPEKPNFVSCEDIISGVDAHFAVVVAKSSVIHFNEYLKTL